MAADYLCEELDQNIVLGWDLATVLAQISENDWIFEQLTQNSMYINFSTKFVDESNLCYEYLVNLQSKFAAQSNLTPGQQAFVNFSYNRNNFLLYKIITDVKGKALYSNIYHSTIVIGLENCLDYNLEMCPTYPTDPTDMSEFVVVQDFDNYPIENIGPYKDNAIFIVNRHVPARGVPLTIPAHTFRYNLIIST